MQLCVVFVFSAFSGAPFVEAQAPTRKGAPPVEKLGSNLFRIGQIRVDTVSREISVPGTVNNVTVLEFVANTRGGLKAYESALTLDTDAIMFNTALVLIGLDKTHAEAPTRHFDSMTPKGDPVEIWVEIPGPRPQRVRAERLIFDSATNETLADGPWVYTGSTIIENAGGQNFYLAETDGVLIGFVHSPAPIIENPRGAGLGRYGSIVLNPNLGLTPGMPVRLTVKALNQAGGDRR